MVPEDWMPRCSMKRIIVHWTAGRGKASGLDKAHYHLMIEGDGKLVLGKHSIEDNASTREGDYAAHTRACNTGSIGVALCGMMEARESPFDPGDEPINEVQWGTLIEVLKDLCGRYQIEVERETVLSHAEVQPTLGIKQSGKWDIARLPWDDSIRGALAVGDLMRKQVKE
jgi:N-acetyl-anhydromuramyl-L-alanine amidase AmpD